MLILCVCKLNCVCDLSCQVPKFSNGRITSFDVKIEPFNVNLKNGSAKWEKILVNTSATGSGSGHNLLKRVLLNDKSMNISVIAINSVGASPSASLLIPDKMFGS